MKHTLFYIPGLGDGYDSSRQKALKLWFLFGVEARLIPMNWDNQESYDEKYQRATDVINTALRQNHRVSLVGESAGASMSINLFADNPNIHRLVTIAGVNASSTTVAPYRLRRSPAFAESRNRVDGSLEEISGERRRAIHTVRALSDNVVRANHSQITGAKNHRLWTVGHLYTIALCLTLLSGRIVHLAKQR